MSGKKIEAFWENATARDIERVMAGGTVEARFRDDETEPWTSVRTLRGWSDGKWVSALCWKQCQVYREPSRYANKPDPDNFRKFIDKAKAGEVSFTCSFVWEGPEPIRAKVGDRIQHPNGCWLEITESGFNIEAALNTIEFTG
jgi:hypothetical protein